MEQALFQKIWTRYIWKPQNMLRANQRASFSKDTEWLLQALKGKSAAGATVNFSTVTGLSAAYRCINILSEMPAKLPVHVYQKTGNGKQKLADDPRAKLLHTKPNKLQTPFAILSIAEAYRQTRGNALLGIHRNSLGMPIELELLPTPHVEIKALEGKVYYHQKENFLQQRVDVVWDHKDVINVPNFSINGIKGISTIEHHKNTLGLAIAGQESAEKFFENGVNFEGYLSAPQEIGALDDDAIKQLKKTWKDEYAGIKGHHNTPLLEGGVQFTPTSMKLKDAQFLETRKYSGLQVCQIFGVPPQKIYDLDNAHYNNVDSLNIEFYIDTVLANLLKWEQELNNKLFFEDEQDLFFKFNIKGLLRADITKQAEYYVKMVQNGILNRDQVRALEDENPIPGGDIYTVQMQMMDLVNAIAQGNNDKKENSLDAIINGMVELALKKQLNGHYKEH